MKNLTIVLIILIVSISCKHQQSFEKYNVPIRTVVTGKVINPVSKEPSVTLALSRIGFEQESIETKLDSSGSFKIEFSTYLPLDAWLVYQTNFQVLLNPGDSLYVELDGSKEDRPELLETIKFGGTSTEVNRQAALFQKLYYVSGLYKNWELVETANKKYEPTQFKIFADSLREENSKFLNDFEKRYNPGRTVSSWATIFLQDDYFGNLSFYPSSHRKANVLKQSDWNVPVSYYDYFKEKYPIEENLQSGHATSSYLDKFIAYMWALRRNELNEYKDQTISESIKDSVTMVLIMKNTSPGLLREAVLTYMLNFFIKYSKIESFEKYKSLAENDIHVTFLKEPLLKKYEIAKEKIAKAKEIEVTRIKALDSFLNGLVTKNKGKVTYVDIWATWCGPCREEFPYSRKLQDEFSNKVDFVFVCIESEERAYKNTLKEFGLKGTHYFLDKEQSRDLSQKLQLNGVPHYILIDKNGKTVAEGFEIRPSEDETKQQIAKLLNL